MANRRSLASLSRTAFFALGWFASSAVADERLEGIACRSVHLQYSAPDAVAFYNEVVVDTSAKGTYFCVCGFSRGYYGIQELGNGKKLLIFSVWDPGKQNDPNVVPDEQRVKLLYKDDAVRVGRFGNEGTGGQSFFDYDWKNGVAYQFLVTATPDGHRTAYTAYFFVPEDKAWKRLVTFSTIAKEKELRGYYSFVEDFRRNRVSATKVRRARFGGGWVQLASGEWRALSRARFTADSNPVLNIDAGIDRGRFFLATGGETKNVGTPLRARLDLPPVDLPEGFGKAPESSRAPAAAKKN